MARATHGYAHRIDVRAPVAEVWRALIEPARLARWYAPAARVDPREGGEYWVRYDGGLERAAHIDVFDAPRRLRLIYMPMPMLKDDDAVIVDDFLLGAESAADGAQVTALRLLGSGVPSSPIGDAVFVRLRAGWEAALKRLKALAESPAAP